MKQDRRRSVGYSGDCKKDNSIGQGIMRPYKYHLAHKIYINDLQPSRKEKKKPGEAFILSYNINNQVMNIPVILLKLFNF